MFVLILGSMAEILRQPKRKVKGH